MLFGTDERIRCLEFTQIRYQEGQALCLAYKTSAHVLGAGIYLSDDGYVLGVVPEDGGKPSSYFSLTAQDIGKLQNEALLQKPLPSYSIPVGDYVWGYLLWPILLVVILWATYSTRHLRTQKPG